MGRRQCELARNRFALGFPRILAGAGAVALAAHFLEAVWPLISSAVLLRAKGEILGTVEAPDAEAAKAAATIQFELDEIQRNRIMVQELVS